MGRLKLTRRVDEHGHSFAVFSQGAGRFSVRVVEGERDVLVATNVDDNGGEVQRVKRTSLADFLNRQPQK